MLMGDAVVNRDEGVSEPRRVWFAAMPLWLW